MIQIENQIISLDIFQKHFVCDLKSCKGACCVEGDSGAPLSDDELQKLQDILHKIKPYMQESGIQQIEKSGIAVYDEEGDLTTSLINNRECVFATEQNGIIFCAIEKAYSKGETDFKKPISCHLFPIRITQYEKFEAINYEKIKICNSACRCGTQLKIPLYIFLKEALIRKYGDNWYKKLLDQLKKM